MGDKDVRRRISVVQKAKSFEEPSNSTSNLTYENPAISVSTSSISYGYNNRRKDSEYLGSSDFIVEDIGNITTTEEKVKSCMQWPASRIRQINVRKLVNKRFPFLTWLPKYDLSCAVGDLVAGITVGLTLIPQALAYAGIAGLPAEYGLYGSFLGCFVYIFFGSSKDVAVGPTAISALLTLEAVKGFGNDPAYAVLLCFLTGLVQILMGFLGLGFLIDFISGPVSSGFTSAAALIILTSQVRDILAIQATGSTFVETWNSIFSNMHNTKLWDAVMGLSCIVVLLLMRVISTVKIGPKENEAKPNLCQNVLNKSFWLFGTARNAILVIVCGFIGYLFTTEKQDPPFQVIGTVPKGMPNFQPPSFGYEIDNNGTIENHGFMEMIENLGSGIIVLPLVGLLENVAVCKAFSNGKPVDATQELIAIGCCNLANSFVQGFPGTGALARSAVNNASGVRTTLSGLYTGVIVVAALLVFTPYFYYIPKAALAGIIIAAVVFMIEVKVVKPMWKSKKSCLIVFVLTLVSCLVLQLVLGILVGVGINLMFILYHAARPKISVERLETDQGTDYLLLTPDRCLIFPSVDYVRNLVTKHGIRQGIPVVIDCSHIYGADYTAATVVEILTQDFAERDQPLLFYNLKPSVSAVFEGVSPKEFIVFYDHNEVDNLLKNRSCIKKEQHIVASV